MSFAVLHKIVTYLVASLGFAGLALGAGSLVAFGIGSVLTWFVDGPILLRSVYRRSWNVAVLALLGLQVLRGAAGVPLLQLGLELAAFLQLSRLGYRRSAREYGQIAVLAFLHLVAATVLSSSLAYGALFIGFVVATPWMLALTHLRAEIERNAGLAPGDAPTPEVRRALASRKIAGPRYLVATTMLALPLFVATAGFFLLFPRVGMGFLTFGSQAGQSVAGFGSDVRLGGFGVIRDDPTVVLRVTPARLPTQPVESASLRLRGTSFDRYQAGRWTRSTQRGETLRTLDGSYSLAPAPRGADVERMSIHLEPLDEPVLFLPSGAIGIHVPPRIRGGRAEHRELVLSPGIDLRYREPDGLPLQYTAYVIDRDLWPAALDGEEYARYLQLPDGSDDVAGLARRVVDGASSARERADRILAYLHGPRFQYSLEQPDTRGKDPLEVFLFEQPRGHCEYFATAMAVMLRASGVPARNVTGFLGGRFNEYGGYYAIRQGDAHSWVEAWFDGAWHVYDPTPPARAAMGPQPGPLAAVQRFFDAARVRWDRYVVAYDLESQVRGLRRALRWFSSFRSSNRSGRRGVERGQEEAPESGGDAELSWLWILAGAVGVGLTVWSLRKRWRSRRTTALGSAARLYGQLDRTLHRLGRPRAAHVTPLEHASALRAEGFVGTATVEAVTTAYLDARFGGHALDAERVTRLRRAIRALPRTHGRG